jgi:GT2 family glycosyltransferase
VIDCVVNYFCKDDSSPLVRASAQFSLTCFRSDPQVSAIFLVDGSATPDQEFCLWCEKLGVTYLHAGRTLSFAEGYNHGIAHCTASWVALSASDIYIPAGFFTGLFESIESLDPGRIGCLIPALTFSDVPSQERLSPRVRRSFMMSLNLNIFPARHFGLIGGVPEQYSGAYNDMEMAIRLRKHHLLIYQIPLKALHYGKLTIGQGSNYRFEADHRCFFAAHPALYSAVSLCNLKLDCFVSGWRRLLFALERHLPLGRYHLPIQKWLWRYFG